MPKDIASGPRQHRRHNPLHEEILENAPGSLRKVSRAKRRERQSKPDEYVDSGMSKKILQIAREQQDELEDEAAISAAMRGDFMGAAARMRFEDEDEEDSEGEYEDADFGDEEIIEEVVCILYC